LFETATAVRQQLADHVSTFGNPAWSPDSSSIVFTSSAAGFVRKDTRDGAETTLFRDSAPSAVVTGWSPDGRVLLYGVVDPVTGFDIWAKLAGQTRPEKYLATPFSEGHAQFSPDGRWVAYASNESGQQEVWVRPYPASSLKFKISDGGGYDPRWRADGRALYYLDPRTELVEVDVHLHPTFSVGPSRLLFRGYVTEGLSSIYTSQYVASPDGQRFLFKTPVDPNPPMTVAVNWASLPGR
jgi:Tol biopolymer transport system component